MQRCSQRVSDQPRVKLLVRPDIAAAMQLSGSGRFVIVRVDVATAKDGQADAVVISGPFVNEEDAWTDARLRLEKPQ